MTDTPANQVQASSAAATTTTTESAAAGQADSSASAAPAAAAAATASSASAPATVGGQQSGGDTWLMGQKSTDYTLQLMATHDEKLMQKYLGKYQFTEPVAYFAFQRDGKQWYAAVYGSYAEKSQAQNAVASLPAGVGKNPPWIRQFGGIHKLMKSP